MEYLDGVTLKPVLRPVRWKLKSSSALPPKLPTQTVGALQMKIVSHCRHQWERAYTGRRVWKAKGDPV